MKTKQQGMTLIGMILTLATVVVLGLVVMRVVPIYIKNYEVKHAIKSLQTLDSQLFSMNAGSNAHILRNRLMNQLNVSGVDSIKRKDVKIVPKSVNIYEVSLQYTSKSPLIANISLLVEFDEKYEINIGAK